MPSPRTRMPIDYFRAPQQFGHRSAGGRRAGMPLQWPPDGSARLLRAAILQHCVVAAAESARHLHPRRPSIVTVAAGGRVDLSHLRLAMRGQTYMQMAEVATLASVAPDAMPDPAWVHDSLVSATLVFTKQITASGRGLPGALGLLTAEQFAGEATLGALQGWVAVEPGAGEYEANERLTDAASAPLMQSTLEQARAAGLPTEATDQPDNIVIRAATADAAPAVAGCYDPTGPILTAHLRADWTADIRDRGWAVIDGHFIAEVLTTRNGLPHTVRAVRLYPETAEDAEGEWVYSADVASVAGPEERPTLTFTKPPRPPTFTRPRTE